MKIIKGRKYLEYPPKGWVKTNVDSPPGWQWYNNGKSRFSGKREIALVRKR